MDSEEALRAVLALLPLAAADRIGQFVELSCGWQLYATSGEQPELAAVFHKCWPSRDILGPPKRVGFPAKIGHNWHIHWDVAGLRVIGACHIAPTEYLAQSAPPRCCMCGHIIVDAPACPGCGIGQ